MKDKVKKVGEAKDILDTIGQVNEHEGIKWTKYFMDLWDKKQWAVNQIEKEKLRKRSKKREKYTKYLHELLRQKLFMVDRPASGYWVETGLNQVGVWLKLHDRMGRKWQRGLKVSGVPKYDLHAVLYLIQSVEDKMWELEESPKTDTGIYLS